MTSMTVMGLDTMEEHALPEPTGGVGRLYAIAPVGLCYLDTELRYLYINEWLARIHGVPVEAHMGRTIDELFENVAAAVGQRLRDVIATGEPLIDGEVTAETPAHPGELRCYAQRYYPDKDDDGTVVGISCVVQDVTERKQADESLRRSERRLKAAQRVAKVGSWERDLVTEEGWWSDETYQIFGVGPEEQSLVHEAFLERVHPDDRRQLRRAVQRARQTGDSLDMEYRIVRPDGEVRVIHGRADVELDDAGRPTQLFGTSQDVTERVQLERELVSISERERERIGRDLHDGLGQTLVGASLSLQALAKNLGADASPYEDELSRVQAMLDASIAETRRISQLLTPIFSTGLGLSAALEELARQIDEVPGINCHSRCSFDGEVYSTEVASHLYRIAQEGIANALKHSQAENIYLNLEQIEDLLCLEVLDDGVGIGDEGARLKGLGLRSMSYRARMINGRLDVAPGERGGTRVLCTCPLQGSVIPVQDSKMGAAS